MVFKLSGLCFLVSYLMVFPAFAILRHRRAAQPRPYRMPRGVGAAWTAASVCWLFIALACVLFLERTTTNGTQRTTQRPQRER
jgi:amino acid transporter